MNSPSEASSALRSEIRLLGNLLGQTLVRQEGQQLLDLVERVRALVKQVRDTTGEEEVDSRRQLLDLLGELDLPTIIWQQQSTRCFPSRYLLTWCSRWWTVWTFGRCSPLIPPKLPAVLSAPRWFVSLRYSKGVPTRGPLLLP